MITRAVNRAVSRVRGDHPHAKGGGGLLLTVLCDLMLISVAVLALGGVALIIVTFLEGLALLMLLIGVGLLVMAALLLLAWEKLFWEPFVHNLSELS